MSFIIDNFKSIILIISVTVLIIYIIKNFSKIKKFLYEVRNELIKVHWSTRHELTGATFVVITITMLMAIFIGVVDLILSKLLSLLFR